jgi:Tol biopolymer transport system component
MRLEIMAPVTTDPVSIALSPDGDTIALVASSNGRPQLWVRSMTTGALHALRDTDGASFPFWSSDSRSIGFFSGEKLYRIGLEGEVPRPIGHAPVGAGGAWSRDGTILFVMVPDAPLMRVPADGGAVAPLASGAPADAGGPRTGERFPQFFPDGRHFLYYVAETRGVFLGQLDSPERRRLLDADAAAVPAAADRILFVRQGNLYEQRFDQASQAMAGETTLIASNVPVDSRGAAALSASQSGTVIYRTGVSSQQRQLVWVNRDGTPLGPADAPDFDLQWNPALSPDGRTVAMTRSIQGNTGVFLLDLERGVKRQLTFDAVPDIYPTWSPKGDYIAFAKPNRSGFFAVFVQPTTSRRDPVAYKTDAPAIPLDWSKDGRYLLCRSGAPQSGWRLVALDVENTGRILPVSDVKFEVKFGQFSPDTAWVTLESNESGHTEIFVQSFPAGEHKVQVSSGGGTQALWRADGRELFYIAPDGHLMAVPVTSPLKAPVIQFGTAVRLFPTRIESTPQGGVSHQYAPAADGQKFLMNNFIEQTSAPIAVILNRGTGR